MTLLDRLRRRPAWEHADPDVRAEAVRGFASDQQALLAEIARSDADPRVRRAALRKLGTPDALAAALQDAEASVRQEAADLLVALAGGRDAEVAVAAVAALTDPRHQVALARTAPLPATRRAALAKIVEPRHLATLAKLAEDPVVRNEALQRVDDPGLLLDVALKSDHKDTATAAVDRLDDADALRSVAARARHKAASRRAHAKLESLGSVTASALPRLPEPVPDLLPAEEAGPVMEVAEPAVEVTANAVADEGAALKATSPEPAVEAAAQPVESPDAVSELPESPPELQQEAPAPDPVIEKAGAGATETMGAAPTPDSSVGAGAPPPAPVSPPTARRDPGPERREALSRAEALCARLESLARGSAGSRRDAESALREARDLVEPPGGLPGKLRQRLREARSVLFARTQELREADEWSRWGNATAQEALCARMESLIPRDDLERVAHELRECDQRWAEFRHAPRDEADALRQRYQTARLQVKDRLDRYFAAKAAQEAENLAQKEALCQQAEGLADSTDWLRTTEELKALQVRWKAIGPAPRHRAEAVWQRFRSACDRFFTRRDEDRKRRDHDHAANLTQKLALCTQAEALSDSTAWEASAAEVRRLQAAWKTIGPVAKKKSEAVWQRFRAACDRFFDRYKRRDELEAATRQAEWENVCVALEALLPTGEPAPAPEGLAEAVQALLVRARQAPPLSKAKDESFHRRVAAARDRLVAAFPDSFRTTDLDPEQNRVRKEKLCLKVEALASGAEPEGASLHGEALARRLKEALAANTIGGGEDAEARRRQEMQDVESAQAAWARVGPVPGEAGDVLETRFRKACARFVEARRQAAPRSSRSAPPTREASRSSR